MYHVFECHFRWSPLCKQVNDVGVNTWWMRLIQQCTDTRSFCLHVCSMCIYKKKVRASKTRGLTCPVWVTSSTNRPSSDFVANNRTDVCKTLNLGSALVKAICLFSFDLIIMCMSIPIQKRLWTQKSEVQHGNLGNFFFVVSCMHLFISSFFVRGGGGGGGGGWSEWVGQVFYEIIVL